MSVKGDTLAERLAEYGQHLKFGSLPGPVVHEAKRRMIDSFACMFGGYLSLPAKAARAVMPKFSGRYSANTLLGDSSTTAEYAAFMNGVLLRYLDYNDTYLSREPAHPSDNIPAALAAGEAAACSGADLITAIVAAYEIQCRLCDAASLRARGWDHVTYGAFSATLAASMLLGLSREETVHALGIAGTASPALRQTRSGELSMWKGCAFANTGRNAVFATLLAKSGMTGPAPVFEGEFGFEKVVSGPLDISEPACCGRSAFRILDTYVKYYPAEYHSQSAIGAAIELSDGIEDISSIESVTVRTFAAAYEIIGSGAERWAPRTRETADHSLPFIVASALLDRNVTVETFSEERLSDERLLALVKRVKVVRDAELDKLYPEAMPNRVEVTFKSGDIASSEKIYPKGHPKDPLSDKEVEDKFRRLSQWYLDDRKTDAVLHDLWRIEELKNAGDVLKLFRRITTR